jgi:YHS domain-containing protein
MRHWLLAIAAGLMLSALSACAPKATDEAAQKSAPMTQDMGKMPSVGAKTASALPADANKTCPTCGDAVDPNVKVVYKGRTVYFCCKACADAFNKDPEKYLAHPAAPPTAPKTGP